MEDALENILVKTTNKRCLSYQNLLFLLCFLEMITGFILIALGYLEVWPKVNYTDPSGYKHVNITLDYDLCDNGTTWTIVKEDKMMLIEEFELYCKKFEITLIGTIYFTGLLIGSFISHYLSDTLGRKRTLIIFSIVLIIAQLFFSINSNLIILYILQFCQGFLYILVALSGIVLINESIDKDKRSVFTSVIYIGFSIGGVIYSLLFQVMDSWRTVFHVVMGIHIAIVITFGLYSYESPRYYLSKGMNEEFKSCIINMAKRSGCHDSFEEEFKSKCIYLSL